MEIDALKAHVDSFAVTSLNSIVLLPYDADRKSFVVQNGSSCLFLKYGLGASPTSHTFRIPPNAIVEIDNYRGQLSAITGSGISSINVTRSY
jgi:hypothetical protein